MLFPIWREIWSLMRRKGTSRKLATPRSTRRRRELKVNLSEILVGEAREQVYLNFFNQSTLGWHFGDVRVRWLQGGLLSVLELTEFDENPIQEGKRGNLLNQSPDPPCLS
jgi:hypothetical protein